MNSLENWMDDLPIMASSPRLDETSSRRPERVTSIETRNEAAEEIKRLVYETENNIKLEALRKQKERQKENEKLKHQMSGGSQNFLNNIEEVRSQNTAMMQSPEFQKLVQQEVQAQVKRQMASFMSQMRP